MDETSSAKQYITAKFIGEDGSRGFKAGIKYALEIVIEENGYHRVKNVYGDQFCIYSTVASFTANWEESQGAADKESMSDEEETPDLQHQPKQIMIADTEASSILDPNTWLQMKSIANDFFKSGVAPKAFQNPLQVLMGLQMGKEMGMQPAESLQSLTVINGIFGVWGKAVPNRLRQHGWSLKYDEGGEGDDQYCTATIRKEATRDYLGNLASGVQEFSETITFKEVEQSGYTKDKYGKLKPGWMPGLNRRLKLRYDVLDVLIKTYVPEVYGPAAGVAEMLLDIPESDINDGKSKSQQRREQIMAAEAKRGAVSDGDFKPSAIEGKEDEQAAN